MDLDELLDSDEETQEQGVSEANEKPAEMDTSDETLDSTQLGAEMDLDELLEPEPETQKQNDNEGNDKPDNSQS